jgi:hypothetical protein
MSRPETLDDVEDRTEQVANFSCDKFLDAPLLLKHYMAFIEAVQKHGGTVETAYSSTVNVFIPKTKKQLQERLQSDQASWDHNHDLYQKVMRGEVIKSYQEYSVKAWAEREGHPEPVFVKEDDDASVS